MHRDYLGGLGQVPGLVRLLVQTHLRLHLPLALALIFSFGLSLTRVIEGATAIWRLVPVSRTY